MKLLIVFLLCNSSYGQECLLQKNNQEYLLKLDSTIDFSKKTNLIKDKILEDKIFKPDSTEITHNCAGNEKVKQTLFYNNWKSTDGSNCGKKILHFIFYKKGKAILELDETLYPNRTKVLDRLNNGNVDKILVLEPNQTVAIFGQRARDSKSIVIYTQDKSIKKLINKMKNK